MMLSALLETAKQRATHGPARRRAAYRKLAKLASRALRAEPIGRRSLESEAHETFDRLDASSIDDWEDIDMKTFKVRLMRVTRDYVEIAVNEPGVTTAAEAEDFVNDRMEDPDFDPVDEAIDGSEYADVDEAFEVLDVDPADPPPGAKTPALVAAAEAAGVPVIEIRLPPEGTADMTGLPRVDQDQAKKD